MYFVYKLYRNNCKKYIHYILLDCAKHARWKIKSVILIKLRALRRNIGLVHIVNLLVLDSSLNICMHVLWNKKKKRINKTSYWYSSIIKNVMTLKCWSLCRFYTHKALKQTLNIIHNKRQYFKYMYKVMGYQLMISGLTVHHGICAINTGERADNMQPICVSTYLNG